MRESVTCPEIASEITKPVSAITKTERMGTRPDTVRVRTPATTSAIPIAMFQAVLSLNR